MKTFWKETLGACGRMLLELFILFPFFLVLGNSLMGHTPMLWVFLGEMCLAGLVGVLTRRFIPPLAGQALVGLPICIAAILLLARAFGGVWPNAHVLPILLTPFVFYRGRQHAQSPWDQILPNYILFTALVLQFIVLLFARLHGITEEYPVLFGVSVPLGYIAAYIVLNHLGLRNLVDEAQARTSASSLTVGGGMKPLNRALLALVLVIGLVLSVGTVLMDAATWVFDKVVLVISAVMTFLFGFKMESGGGGGGGGDDMAPFENLTIESGDMSFWGPVLTVISYIGVALVAVGVIWLLYRFVRWLIRTITGVLSKFGDADSVKSGEGVLFEDTRESLLDLSQLPKLYADSARERLAGLFKRQPGWNDMPTPAEKLKYLYRKALKKAEGAGYAHRASYTPHEAVRSAGQSWHTLEPQAEKLADSYDALRYGAKDPDPDALEKLHHELGDL